MLLCGRGFPGEVAAEILSSFLVSLSPGNRSLHMVCGPEMN